MSVTPDRVPGRRSRAFPAVATAFLAGILIAAVVIPSRPDAQGSTGGPLTLGTDGGATSSDAGTGAGAGPAAAVGAPAADAASAPVAGSPAAGSSTAAAPGAPGTAAGPAASGNSGASARGVTATEITIGVIDLDSSDLGAVCPRCDNGPSKDGSTSLAMVERFKRDHRLPVGGRNLKFVFQKVQALSPETSRSACVAMAQQVKPFLVIAGPGTEPAVTCLTQEFKIPVLHAAGASYAPDEDIRRVAPLWIEIGVSGGRQLRNYAHWMDQKGLLKGHTIGIYAPEDDNANRPLDVLRAELKKLGANVAVDMRASGAAGVTSQSDPVAVQRFRSANVDQAILFAPASGFQKAAVAQGYRPKYPMTDWASNFTDAVADIFYDADAMDTSLGHGTRWWGPWTKRNPATPDGSNPAATTCLDAYSTYTKRQLDVFDNDAEVHYVLELCTEMEVLMTALEKTGGNLTYQSFVNGVQQIRGLNTAMYPSVSFPGRLDGADLEATFTFTKARHQPDNDYWFRLTPFTALSSP